MSFINRFLPALKEIPREDQLESITASYTYTGDQAPDILRLVVQNELCLYGHLKDNSIFAHVPIPLKDILTEISEKFPFVDFRLFKKGAEEFGNFTEVNEEHP